MKYGLLVLTFFLAAATSPSTEMERWIIDASSELIISGATNVNDFICRTDCYDVRDTLELLSHKEGGTVMFSRNAMVIPVSSFECGNDLITRDFQETLKVNEYPELTIRFVSIDDRATVLQAGAVTGKVEITLAGTTRVYSVLYSAASNGRNTFSLTGKQAVCFSDFNLEAPRKMMGLIKVQDNLEVEFQLHLVRI
jgi:hypothetical protein